MASPHYPAAAYNTETQDEIPNIPDDELLHMNEDDIRTRILEDMEDGPANDVPEDMGRANYQPQLNATTQGVDEDELDDQVERIMNHRDKLINAKRARNRVEGLMNSDSPIDSGRAA